MSRRSDLPLSKENREYFESIKSEAEPYAEDDPEFCRLDGTGYNWDRREATLAAGFLKQDDAERARLGLRENEYPEVNGGKVYKIYK